MKTPHTLYRANGDIEDFPPANGEHYTLEELQQAVGGLIQIVETRWGNSLVVNEEGKLKGLPYNDTATRIFGFEHDVIVGDALLIHPSLVQ